MPPVGSVTELSLPALGIDPGRTGARCSATDVPRASRAGEAAARHGGEPARRFRSSVTGSGQIGEPPSSPARRDRLGEI